jgi:hypothetical protein
MKMMTTEFSVMRPDYYPTGAQPAHVSHVPVNIMQQRAPAVPSQQSGRILGRGWTRPTQGPTVPSEVDSDDGPDYHSDGAESYVSRRDRAEARRQARDDAENQRRRSALEADACKEYSKARPPAFNEEAMDIWLVQFVSLLSSLPSGLQLVSAFKEHPSVGIYSADQSSSVFHILLRAFDSKIKTHVRALSSIISAAERRPDAPAHAAYSALVAEFLPDSHVTTTALHSELHLGSLPQESGLDFVHRLESIIRRLKSLGSFVGDEDFQAATIIRGLPELYKPIRQAFFGRSKASWTIADVKSSIKDIDFQQARCSNGSSSHFQDGAFLASSIERRTCLRCHRPGHLAQD